jgi:hypothetical protein
MDNTQDNFIRGFATAVIASIVANFIYAWFGAPLLQNQRFAAALVPTVINGLFMGVLALLALVRDWRQTPRFAQLERGQQEIMTAMTQLRADMKADMREMETRILHAAHEDAKQLLRHAQIPVD